MEFILSDGEQGSAPNYFIALDHARTVARYLNCSVQEAERLSPIDFQEMLACAQAEIIAKEQVEREAARKGRHG